MRWRRAFAAVSRVVALLVLLTAPVVSAAEATSSNYSVDRVFFGAGGELNACSGTYCAKQSAGEIAAGNTASAAFKAQAGFNVDREPYLAFSVSGTSVDIGYLSQFGTATTSADFAVKTYLASGYVVQVVSDPPTSNSIPHQLTPLASPTAPSIGTEQFGINLVRNQASCGSAVTVGADPVQVPDNTFSFGAVASGYGTCGQFKYVKGDTIASSTQSSGETDFKMSFIYNISDLTPDGEYTYNGVLVATSTY